MTPATSKLVRRIHLYLALFLTPWMIIYALSGLALNHGPTVRSWFGAKAGQFEKIEEREFTAAFSADATPRMIGAQVLEQLGLAGTFQVQGTASQPKLVITRNGAFAAHRVTYFRAEQRVLIEKQAYTPPVFLNRAHFRHGYEQPFLAATLWAVVVDLAIVGLIFWGLSGLWMWWEIKPARRPGAVCALAGVAIFGLLLATI